MTEEKQEPQEKVSILKKLKINNIAEKNKRKFYKFAVYGKIGSGKPRLLQEIKTLSSLTLTKVEQRLLTRIRRRNRELSTLCLCCKFFPSNFTGDERKRTRNQCCSY
ncbi:Uncharacterised protein [Staphylococcus aureus]|nr:Uncharacterised protein [Staphylococcus aureus]